LGGRVGTNGRRGRVNVSGPPGVDGRRLTAASSRSHFSVEVTAELTSDPDLCVAVLPGEPCT